MTAACAPSARGDDGLIVSHEHAVTAILAIHPDAETVPRDCPRAGRRLVRALHS